MSDTQPAISSEEFNRAQTKHQSMVHDQLTALDQATEEKDELKIKEANQALENVFGKFTPLVVESWRGASSIREKQSK